MNVLLACERARADAVTATLRVTFQGCQTDGICYPPMTRRVALSIPQGSITAASQPVTAAPITSEPLSSESAVTVPRPAADEPAAPATELPAFRALGWVLTARPDVTVTAE